MKKINELAQILDKINQKGYKAYKDIKGIYQDEDHILAIDHVQGDPFAAPSRIRIIVSQTKAGFPAHLYQTPDAQRAVSDFLSRLAEKQVRKSDDFQKEIGKSEPIRVGHCGQEILTRNFVLINKQELELRLEVVLPAAGRKILGGKAKNILLQELRQIAKKVLFFSAIDSLALQRQFELVEDQAVLRRELQKRKLVAFVANGSLLPRESGVSQKPLRKGGIEFISPVCYEVTMELPNFGQIKGMGIPEGVTLIVGGGFHGKSTLLQALELGIYDHIAGDGREYLVTRENAVKIKAENGRQVNQVDISFFIKGLPLGQDTTCFFTENASGSTSQAANIMEALEIGTDLFLIDEDTSATNFMIRDEKMQRLVSQEKEPITPFIKRVRSLYEEKNISTILVIGGSGDYFQVADQVIMLDNYQVKDVTAEAKKIGPVVDKESLPANSLRTEKEKRRIVLQSSFKVSKELKVKSRGKDQLIYQNNEIDLQDIEQLIDPAQTRALAFILLYAKKYLIDDQRSLAEIVELIADKISQTGLDSISSYHGHPGNLVLPRKYEIAAMFNRFREMEIRVNANSKQ